MVALAVVGSTLPMAVPSLASAAPRHLFGSSVELFAPQASRDAVAAVWHDLEQLNQRWNAWKPGELTEANHAFRHGRVAHVSADLVTMIREAARWETLSEGCFNPAIGALVGLWGFHADVLSDGPAPSLAQRAMLRKAAPSLRHLRIDGLRVRSDNPWVQLDFGAYAKGVAIDRAWTILRRHGVHDALLNLGGNLATMGRFEGRDWRIGIRDPHGPGLLATWHTDGAQAVVTSGSYERRRRAGGRSVAHVLDPFHARSTSGLDSVTVVADSAAAADALSTALMVAGPRRWRAMAQRLGADKVLVVHTDGTVQATEAMQAGLRRGMARG